MHRLKNVLVREKLYGGLGRFDRIPKWHMISHYADSIRELGTPDGYNTEAPEYLHIVYVKRPWEASNKRDAIPQIIKYCQRLEALRIHRAYLNELYGEQEREGEVPTMAVFVDDDGGEYHPEEDRARDEEDDEDAWEDMEDDDDEGEEGERRPSAASDADPVEYPTPEFAIAMRPTRRATLQDLVGIYGATELEQALKKFLRPYTHSRYYIVPSDYFDVWHKLTLYHLPLSFAPDEPSQCDVIRARPIACDTRGRVLRRREPAFDTALFLHDRHQFGLHRYRAGRVRAIFRLPERLHYLYSGELVYLELFTPFNPNPSSVHGLHTTSHANAIGKRQCIVVPIQDIALGCHLAPRFQHVDPDLLLVPQVDLLSRAQRFFFNHYYNRYIFQLIQYWRHLHELPAK
ncbi:hypothetical protein FRC06_004778 [Ceratobasidium sp. 370]|nr:hypothetical protein FRC06_004778 [Ceratobasidium sp. 370]